MKSLELQCNNRKRILYYDGLKGLATLLVVACHLAYTFSPSFYFPEKAANRVELFWHKSFFYVLTNGNAAVHCFL